MKNIKETVSNLLDLYSVQSSVIQTGLEYNYLIGLLRTRHAELILPLEEFLGIDTSYFLELGKEGDIKRQIDSYSHRIDLNTEKLNKVLDALDLMS